MFGFKQKNLGNRKNKPVRNLKESSTNANTKPYLIAALVSILAITVVFVHDRYKDQILMPITHVVILGEHLNVTADKLKSVVLSDLKQGFFNIDLNGIAQNIENINWVAQATLRRVWPNTVEILIREHQAVAVWDERTLLSANGILFNVDSVDGYQNFARVHGQDYQAKELLLAYSQLEQLVAEFGLHVNHLNSVKSSEMKVQFNTQLNSIFALQDKDIQFGRFVALIKTGYLKMSERENTLNKKALKSIDLRYSNGFSVVWQEPQSHLSNKRVNTEAVMLTNGNQHV